MKISYRLRIPRSCLQRAEVALTVISLCGSIAQYGTAQDSSPPTSATDAVPAKPIAAPPKEPNTPFEAPPARLAAPGERNENPARLLPSEEWIKTDKSPPRTSSQDPNQTEASRSDTLRLQLLEKQILELTSELRALRAEKRGDSSVRMTPPQASSSSRRSPTSKPPKAEPNGATDYAPQMKPAPQVGALQPRSETQAGVDVISLYHKGAVISQNPLAGNPDVQSVTITRSTYKLPAGRAEALAKLLTELLDDEFDIKVKGEALQVTAPAQDQQAIERVIQLFLRRAQNAKPLPPQSGPY